MNREDEIKQINEIINKLDIISDDEWQRKEEEAEEEYNERIGIIEEEIEEALLDYISDSLLVEQEINEEEAIKEAQEKIQNDYEIFSEAFIENSDSTITLKSEEDLKLLGYDTPEEIQKLKDIENNKNAPEQYFNQLKESIKSKKYIDIEINRKMELAKSIIDAKKRGETIPTSLNLNFEKDKFEKANEYIARTGTLKRIPIIQNEYINNNYIVCKRYDDVIKNYNKNNRTTSNNKVATTSTMQVVELNEFELTKKVVFKRVPERKDVIYTNLERKLDKNNDLTKQKIKARTELKSIFKQIGNKELSKEELEETNSNVEIIKKKYPNIVDDKLIEKISKKFNVKLSKICEPSKIITENIGKIERQDKYNDTALKDEELGEKKAEKVETKQFDDRRKEILNVISKFNEDNKSVLNMPEQYIFFIANYLNNNDDEYVRNNFNKMILKLENSIQGNFEKEFIEKGIDFNIGLLDYLYQTYNDENGRGIVKPNKQKAIEFLHKELNYFAELRNKIYSSTNNTIECIKNEARFSNTLKKLKNSKLSTKIPVMPLIINYELARRNQVTGDITNIIKTYKKKIEKNDVVSEIELDELGRIAYEGIKDLSGNVIVEPDKILAKNVYEKLITDYRDKRAETNYNRLYDLYSDQTLPIYDEIKANELKVTMKQKEIKVKKEDMNKNKRNKSNSRTYVCSDLHGQYSTYEEIIKKLKNTDKLYVLGDVIDRGPDGIKILQDIMKNKEKGQIEFIVGNHEIMMMKSLFFNDKKESENWEQNNGGDVTKQAFERLTQDEQNKIKEFILDSYVYKNININSQQIHMVHAKAIQPENEIEDKTVRELLKEGKMDMIEEAVWCRDNSGTENKNIAKKGTFTIIGHTPTDSKMIEYKNGYLNIDCGAAYEERESLVDLQNGTVEYFNIQDEKMKEKDRDK